MKKVILPVIITFVVTLFSLQIFAQEKKQEKVIKEEVKTQEVIVTTPLIQPSPLTNDITILRVLNLFQIKKEQIDKLIPVIEEGIQKREKNLTEIRGALLEGKQYGELKDTYLSKLDRTNSRIVGKIMEILDEEQKKTAQIIFNLITEDEMMMLMQSGPALLEMITSRIKLMQNLGIMPISEEAFSTLMQPMAQIGLELLSWIQSRIKEISLNLLIQPRTVELLKEMKKVRK